VLVSNTIFSTSYRAAVPKLSKQYIKKAKNTKILENKAKQMTGGHEGQQM
jgi:hypothetical protein